MIGLLTAAFGGEYDDIAAAQSPSLDVPAIHSDRYKSPLIDSDNAKTARGRSERDIVRSYFVRQRRGYPRGVQDNADNKVDSPVPVHENLIFNANILSDHHGTGLFILRANGVVVDNQFKNTNLFRLQESNVTPADLNGGRRRTRHNVHFLKYSMQAGPILLDTKSTDRMRQ